MTGLFSLAQYAEKRLERQSLARAIVNKQEDLVAMRRVDRLTDELNFGFWHNPAESVAALSYIVKHGACRALESESGFIAELITPQEKEGLSGAMLTLIASYYLGLLRASAAYLDAAVFTRLRAELEPLRESLPVFVLPRVRKTYL